MNKLLHRFCRLSLLLICILCSSSLFATEVSVTIGDYATTNGWANGTKYESVTLDANVTATVSATDANSGKYYTTGNQWRLYQTGNATLTIATSSGTLSSVKVTYASQNNGVLKNGTETVASDAVLSVTGSSITLSVGNSGSATNGQARVTAITVVYEADGGGSLTCATPTFDPAAGTYTSAQSVTISTTTPGATIYYTTDGNDPVVSGNVYSGPITVSTSQTIKAIASAAGYESSSIATAVYNIVNLEHAGTEADPYTVADALIAIDAGVGTTDVYVKGIVSGIKTAYSSAYGNISYNISDDGSDTSDQLLAYRGKSFNGDNFTSENDILVGDEVVVNGNLTKYGSTYELAADNKLVSLNRPSSTVVAPTLTPSATSAEAGSDVTITVSQTDFDGDAGEIWYTTDGTDPKTSSTKQVLDDSTINTITVTMADADIVVTAVATKDGGSTFSDAASVTITYVSLEAKTLPYTVDLLSSATGQSDFTFEQTTPTIWKWDSRYGAVGKSGSKVDAEGWLISPLISLEGATAPVVTWEEVLKLFGNVDNEATVWLREGTTGTWERLTVETRDDNENNWTYTSVGDVDLSAYIGKTIQIGFKYVSTTSDFGTWEIKNFSVTDGTAPYTAYTVATAVAACSETNITADKTIDNRAELTFTDATVVYVTTNKKNVHIREGENAIMVYDTSAGHGLNVGDMLTGTVQGELHNYKGDPEFIISATDMSALKTGTEEVYSREATLADIQANKYRTDLVKVVANAANFTNEGTADSPLYYIADDASATNKTRLYGMTNGTTGVDALATFATGTVANYDDIRIIGVVSNFNGTPQLKPTDIGLKVTVDEACYATYYTSEFAICPPKEDYDNAVRVSTYQISGNELVELAYCAEDNAVAPNVGMVVKAPAGDYYLSVRKADWSGTISSTGSALLGTDTDTTVETDPSNYYFILSYFDAADKAGTAGFFFPTGTGEKQLAGEVAQFTNKAHKAYAKVAVADVPAGVVGFTFNNGLITGIDSISTEAQNGANEAVYTLSGVRVQNVQSLPKGIYVKNGKKVVVK